MSPTVTRAWVKSGMHFGQMREIKTRNNGKIVVYSIAERDHVGLLHADGKRTVHTITALGPQNNDLREMQDKILMERPEASFICTSGDDIKEQGAFAASRLRPAFATNTDPASPSQQRKRPTFTPQQSQPLKSLQKRPTFVQQPNKSRPTFVSKREAEERKLRELDDDIPF